MSLITYIKLIDATKDQQREVLKGDYDLHSHLTDAADWNAAYWDFDLNYLATLADELRTVFDRSPKGFVFRAVWAGDSIDNRCRVSIDDFVAIVEGNRIGTKTEYIVCK